MQLFSFHSCKERSLLNWITQRLITGSRNCPTQDLTLPITDNAANTVAATVSEGSSHPQSPPTFTWGPVIFHSSWPTPKMTVLSAASLPPLSLSQTFLLVLCTLYFDFMPNSPWWNVGFPEDTTSPNAFLWSYFLSSSRPWEEEVNPLLLQHCSKRVLLSPPQTWGFGNFGHHPSCH